LPTAKILIDTDIGVDIDDAFALALAFASPRLQILGISTTSGDVALRARLVDRLLSETGEASIPVAIGLSRPGPFDEQGRPVRFTQARWAKESRLPLHRWPSSTAFILNEIRQFPGQITLVCIGPLTNIAALQKQDPQTFRKLERIVMMGGSIKVGYADSSQPAKPPPVVEYNIREDIPAAQTVFQSGVPIVLLPLDSTQVPLDETRRDQLFALGTPLTDALTLLYHEWSALNPWGIHTPTLYDVVAVAQVSDPETCPTQPMHIVVDGKGYTRSIAGKPNALVCLQLQRRAFFDMLMTRLLKQRLNQ
jgi:inosine-uridine nucleoside N-ribohydrolase